MVGSASGLTNFNTNEMGILSVKLPVLYSTGCPKCTVLKKKLDMKGIKYEENNDTKAMESLGMTQVPALLVDGKLMDFSEAVKWVGTQN